MTDPEWVFPEGTPNEVVTDSDGLGLGPVFLYDVMELRWTPDDQRVTVQLACDQDGGSVYIGENSYDSSPSYWDLTEVPSDENPACHFAFKDAEHGNAKYFQYVHTAADDGSTTFSASSTITALPNTPASSSKSGTVTMVGDPVFTSSSAEVTEASAKPSPSVSTVIMSASSGGFRTIVTSISIAPPATRTGVRPPSAPSTILGGDQGASPSPSSTSSSSSPPGKSTNTTAIGVGVGVSVGVVALIAAMFFYFYSKKRKSRQEKPLGPSSRLDGRLTKPSPPTGLATPRTGHGHNSLVGLMPVEKEQHLAPENQKSALAVSYPHVSELGGYNVQGFQAQTTQIPYPHASELGGNNGNAFAQTPSPVPAPLSYPYELATHQQNRVNTRNHVEPA